MNEVDELDKILMALCVSASAQNGKGSPTYGVDYQNAKSAVIKWACSGVIAKVCDECDGDGGAPQRIAECDPSCGVHTEWEECEDCEGRGVVLVMGAKDE